MANNKKSKSESAPMGTSQTPNETNETTFEDLFEQVQNFSPYRIDTGHIFEVEQEGWNDTETNLKKLSKKLGYKLEAIIRDIQIGLIIGGKSQLSVVMPSYNPIEPPINGQPFQSNYFFTDSEKNLIGVFDDNQFSIEDHQYDRHLYKESVQVQRMGIDESEFELLFAFAIRQCAVMRINEFLDFHLTENFDDELYEYLKFLKSITRAYADALFSDGLIESIHEWIRENEITPSLDSDKKIETVLTVDNLSCLFRLLKEHHLITEKNKRKLVRFFWGNFSSKEKEEISFDSAYNKFHSYSHNAMSFWESQFSQLAALASKLKEEAPR